MRITLTIADDVLAAAKEMAASQRKSVGEMISALSRKALCQALTSRSTRNGIPLLRVRPNCQRVTSALVRRLREELD